MSERNLTASSVEKKLGLKISAVGNILNNKSANPAAWGQVNNKMLTYLKK